MCDYWEEYKKCECKVSVIFFIKVILGIFCFACVAFANSEQIVKDYANGASTSYIAYEVAYSSDFCASEFQIEIEALFSPNSSGPIVVNQKEGDAGRWAISLSNGKVCAKVDRLSKNLLVSDAPLLKNKYNKILLCVGKDSFSLCVNNSEASIMKADVGVSKNLKEGKTGLLIGRDFPTQSYWIHSFFIKSLKISNSKNTVAHWKFDDVLKTDFPDITKRNSPAKRCHKFFNHEQNYKFPKHKDASSWRKTVHDFAKEVNLDINDFPELNARDSVWNLWNFQYENFGEIDFKHERAIAHIKNDAIRNSLVKTQVYDSNSLVGEGETPSQAVLRRVSALANLLKKENPTQVEQFDSILKRVALLKSIPNQKQKEIYFIACALKREATFKNPRLQNFGDMLAITRGLYEGSVYTLKDYRHTIDSLGGHFVNQFYGQNAVEGGGIYRIKNWGNGGQPKIENLLENSIVQNGRFKGRKLNFGAFATPDVSYCGKKIVFAWTPNNTHAFNIFSRDTCFHIFIVNADGSNLRQLTDDAYDDFDPCFLPDGKIAFVSSRRGGYIRCFDGFIRVPNYTMFSMSENGENIKPMSYFETAEWNPIVNNDGMLTYTRWDYTDRENCIGGRFWIANPDGSNPRAPHGNYPHPLHTLDDSYKADMKRLFPKLPENPIGSRKYSPLVEMGFRQIPESKEYVFTAAPHHGQSFGSLCILDLNVVDDGYHSQVKRLTPYEPYPESESHNRLHYKFGTPYPLSKDFFIANAWENLVVLDKFGNLELLCDIREVEKSPDNRFRLIEPLPLSARKEPSTAIGIEKQESKPATIFIANVYDTDMPLPKGVKIKWLRVIQNVLKTNHAMGEPMIGNERENTPRIPLGLVPVEDDGSVYFEAPVAKELIFQLVDENFRAVNSMRSVAFVFPSEQMSCQGCHEPTRKVVSRNSFPKAQRRSPSKLIPEMSKVEAISYYRHIKPILEKAHIPELGNNREYEALKDLTFWVSGGMFGQTSSSYSGTHGGSRTIAGRFGASHSKLSKILRSTENLKRLSDEERRLVDLWLDCNSLRLGAYREEKMQLKGHYVSPILDVDERNPFGVETSPVKLQKNFWHENSYGPFDILVTSLKNNEIFITNKNGEKTFSYKVKNLKEACLLANGNIAIATENFAMEISLDKRVVWQYNQKGISSIQQIDNGNLLLGIADETCKFVEIKDGKQVVCIDTKIPCNKLGFCRKTSRNTFLAPFVNNSVVREFDVSGKQLREINNLYRPMQAVELPNENILISCNGRVREFDKSNNVVWEIRPVFDTPDIEMSLPMGIVRLQNGDTVICNFATTTQSNKKTSHIFEITPDKRVVWEVESTLLNGCAQVQILENNKKPSKK